MVGRTRKRNYDEEGGDAPESSAKRVDVVTPRIPLAYESLKCVLEYLEPNRRFEVFRRLPSVRTTESLVPLKIKELKFQDNSVIVDRVTYSLGIYRELKKGVRKPRIPYVVTRDNNLRGTLYDIDEYGYREVEYDDIVTPGDISLMEQLEHSRVKMTREEGERELERLKNPQHREAARMMSEDMEKRWRQEKSDKRYLLERFVKSQPLPLDYFIQLTVEEEGKETQIRRAPYIMKLYQAMKILTTTLFHHTTTHVRRLEVQPSEIILRLPANLKFQVQTVALKNDALEVLNKLKPIFTTSSFPLQYLETYMLNDNNFTATENLFKKLVIYWSSNTYQRYHLLPRVTQFVQDHYFNYEELVRYWLREPRDIGTCLYVSYQSKQSAIRALRAVNADGKEIITREERRLTIRVNQVTMIEATVYTNRHKQQWIARFRVVPIE